MNTIFNSNIANKVYFTQKKNKVFVYIVDMDSCIQDMDKFWICLSPKEKQQAQEYYNNMLTNRYIISHGILRYIISHYIDQCPKSVEFIYNKYSKPFIKNSNIQFNMSHSNNMVYYVIALDNEVGIDIENNTLEIKEIFNLVFTPKEIKFLNTLLAGEKLKMFYKFWTQKESLIKAIGQGFSYPINNIEVISLMYQNKINLKDKKNKFMQTLYCYPLKTSINYTGTLAAINSIDEIVYLEINYKHTIFDNMKIVYLN